MKLDPAGGKARPAIARVTFLAAIIITVAALYSCGADGTASPKTPVAPQTTAVGNPTGPVSSQVIGPNGGSVTSQDGKLTVTIPAGALSAATTVSVQPVSALAPAAVGAAYRLEPSGTTFGTPVSVVFHYDSTAVIGSTPQLLWVASQDSSGAWPWAASVTVDSTAHTVTVAATHFSDWSLVQGMQIRPPNAEVAPSATVALQLKYCEDGEVGYDCDPPSDPSGEDLPPLPIGRVDPGSWAVNGVRGGSSTYGTVTGSATGATYTAPSNAPANNSSVAVSVGVLDRNGHTLTTLVSNIRILESGQSYHIVGGYSFTGDTVSQNIISDVTDHLEFDVDVSSDGGAVISDTANSPSMHANDRPDSATTATNTVCKVMVTGTYEHATFDQFVGAVYADSVTMDVFGKQLRAAATITRYDGDHNCTVAGTQNGETLNIRTRFDFKPSLFPHVGSDVIVLGTDDQGNSDNWVFDIRRTK